MSRLKRNKKSQLSSDEPIPHSENDMRIARVDDNQSEIVDALRKGGAFCNLCGAVCLPDTKGRVPKYCSRFCAGKAVGLNGLARERGALNEYRCANCGKQWKSYYKTRKFCSRKCFGEDKSKHGAPSLRGIKLKDETKAKIALAVKENMRRYGSRRDKNHPLIVDAFRKLGCEVIDMAEIGNGCPDIAVYCRRAWHVIEIKNPETKYGKSGLSKSQRRWAAAANAPVYTLSTITQVARFVNGDTDGMLHVVESAEQALQILGR